MPRKSKAEIAETAAHIDSLETEVEGYRQYRAWLPVARMLEEEVQRLIAAKYPSDGSAPDPESYGYEFEDIGERAFANIRKKLLDKAMEEKTAAYESQHRKDLYARLMDELDAEQGEDISEKVRLRVEADPELAVELRKSAREEIGARALGVIHTEITTEQEKIVEEEAERQLNLDRLDVRFALDKELDLDSPEVKELLQPGDKLVVMYDDGKGTKKTITFVWTKDANGGLGWLGVADDTKASPVFKEGGKFNRLSMRLTRFVSIGALNKDHYEGRDVVQQNKLVQGLPLVVTPFQGKETTVQVATRTDTWGDVSMATPFTISSIDFQTKDLVFTNGVVKKDKKDSKGPSSRTHVHYV